MRTPADNFEENQERSALRQQLLPSWLRLIVASLVLVAIGGCLWIIVRYVMHPEYAAAPDKLGLSSILIFLVLLFVLLVIPFEKFNLQIKKIGPLEFEKVIQTQATERAEELAEVRESISRLEQRFALQLQTSTRMGSDRMGSDRMGSDVMVVDRMGSDRLVVDRMGSDRMGSDRTVELESVDSNDLKGLLISFLNKHRKWAFSPSRIEHWGTAQAGFAALRMYSSAEIRNALQALVRDGVVKTSVSKKGNTLYKIS